MTNIIVHNELFDEYIYAFNELFKINLPIYWRAHVRIKMSDGTKVYLFTYF